MFAPGYMYLQKGDESLPLRCSRLSTGQLLASSWGLPGQFTGDLRDSEGLGQSWRLVRSWGRDSPCRSHHSHATKGQVAKDHS